MKTHQRGSRFTSQGSSQACIKCTAVLVYPTSCLKCAHVLSSNSIYVNIINIKISAAMSCHTDQIQILLVHLCLN